MKLQARKPIVAQHEEITIRGEYWIDKHGGIEFADGDSGDQNHESIVIGRCLAELGEHVGLHIDEPSWDNIEEEFAEREGIPYDEVIPKLVAELAKTTPNARRLVDTARGHGDAREYAMEFWGEKWCRGNNITSWLLTPDDLKAIARGVEEILFQEGEHDDYNEDDVEITVRDKNGNSYYATLSALKEGVLQRNPSTYENHAAATEKVKKMDLPSMDPYYKGKVGD